MYWGKLRTVWTDPSLKIIFRSEQTWVRYIIHIHVYVYDNNFAGNIAENKLQYIWKHIELIVNSGFKIINSIVAHARFGVQLELIQLEITLERQLIGYHLFKHKIVLSNVYNLAPDTNEVIWYWYCHSHTSLFTCIAEERNYQSVSLIPDIFWQYFDNL